MYTLDANIFARDADPTDPNHLVCRTLLEALDHGRIPIIVPNLLLAEVAASVSRTRRDPIRARIVADSIAAFEHIRLVPLDDALAHEAAELARPRPTRRRRRIRGGRTAPWLRARLARPRTARARRARGAGNNAGRGIGGSG